MAEKVLIIHHLEPYWDDAMKCECGTSFDEMLARTYAHLLVTSYDRIVLHYYDNTLDNDQCFEEIYKEFSDFIDERYTYPPGLREPKAWMRSLAYVDRHPDVYICGAFDEYCVLDLEIALRFINVPYTRIESLII